MRKTFLSIVACASLFASNAHSELKYVLPDEKSTLSGQDINIHFWGAVSDEKIIDLESVIDKININYPQAKTINLYINSEGGSMDAGWAGYAAIKSSKIPIRTINEAKTDSSATLFYCASAQRYVMNGATFRLHPAAVSFNSGYYQPDDLARKEEYLKNLNDYFSKAYSECTNLNKNDIQKMLTTEYSSRTIGDAEAVKIGLANGILSVEYPSGASAYIFDPDKS